MSVDWLSFDYLSINNLEFMIEGALTYLQTDFKVLKVKKLHFLCFTFLLDEIFEKSEPF